MKKILSILIVLTITFGYLLNIFTSVRVRAVDVYDASQFVQSIEVSNAGGPIENKKISDSSSIKVEYQLVIGDGKQIEPEVPYTMSLPSVLNYTTSVPIELYTINGERLGNVTISNNQITIYFDKTVTHLSNVSLYFSFWSGFHKTEINYESGNDLTFPIKDDPNNTVHLDFFKSNSGGGSGTSAISKSLTYGEDNIVNWTVTINNGGYDVADAIFVDVLDNSQEYVLGSTEIKYRNWQKQILNTETKDLEFISQADGSQQATIHFGKLISSEEENPDATTSIIIRYQTHLIYNKDNNRYPNHAYSYDGMDLIDEAISTATYRGQSGGGEGDEIITVKGEKHWDDYDNKFKTRPASIIVELYQNDKLLTEQEVKPNEEGSWLYEFKDVLKYDESGEEYNYRINEKTVPNGYVVEVQGTDLLNSYANEELISVKGEKHWNDYDNKFKTRPASIIVELYQNDKLLTEQEVKPNEEGSWLYEFKDVLKYDESGEEYNYRINEKTVPNGYVVEVQGTDLLNSYANEELISVKGEKHWNDYDNKFKTRPASIIVELYQNDKLLTEQEVKPNEEGSWLYEFKDVLKYDESGEEYNYRINEKTVPNGYVVEVQEFNMVNKLKKTIVQTSETNINPKVDVKKIYKSSLPKTGSQQQLLFFWLGLLELALICQFIVLNRKRKELL
ncbi:Cna B-type domain-containing protein [Vagococcus fluvialis]|uniref:Cna B-type domain-containing protein n=1 Tax=Vagococcus fluvialis TaxID=2738 RepID=UPI003D0B411E